MYSMRLCRAMKKELLKIEIHGLCLVSCFLYPFLRDIESWKDHLQRECGISQLTSLFIM